MIGGLEALKQKLKGFFSGRNDVAVAYLFGSVGRSDAGPLSDVDIAVLLDAALDAEKRFLARLDLTSRIGRLLGTNKVDVVILNEAPPSLSYNIIKDGIVLKSDETARALFESRVLSVYLDRKYFFDRHDERTVERMAGAYA